MLVHSENASPAFRELIGQFKGMRLAHESDAQALAHFINDTSMSAGQIRIGFTRGEDYFALLRLQADKFAALICEEEGQIVGVGALTVRSTTLRGRVVNVGYFQDLRVAPNASARTRQTFYNCFTEFVRVCPQLEDFDRCSFFLTAILDDNMPARSALSRTSFPLEYTRLTHYTAHLWPKVPLVGTLLSKFGKPNTSGLSPELMTFYKEQLGRLAFDLTLTDLERLAEHATPIEICENNDIIGACLLVQTDKERQLRTEHAGLHFGLSSVGTFITALRTARKLSPEKGLLVKRKLLNKALRESARHPGLFTGYIESDENLLRPSLLQSLSGYRTRGSLYRVFHSEHTTLPAFTNGFLRPTQAICFEWVYS